MEWIYDRSPVADASDLRKAYRPDFSSSLVDIVGGTKRERHKMRQRDKMRQTETRLP
jgi:hypothetical protein